MKLLNRKLSDLPAVARAREQVNASKAAGEKLRDAFDRTFAFPAEIEKARSEFLKAPHKQALLDRWIELESTRGHRPSL